MVRSIVWMSEQLSPGLCDLLSSEVTVVSSARAFLDARRDAKTVSFVDNSAIADLDRAAFGLGTPVDRLVPLGPVIAICDEPLQTAIPSIPGSVIGPFLSQPLVVEVGGLDTAPVILAISS